MKTQGYFKIGLLFASCLALVSACGPSAEQLAATVEAAVAETQTAQPSQTPTTVPSATPTPIPTSTPSPVPSETLTPGPLPTESVAPAAGWEKFEVPDVALWLPESYEGGGTGAEDLESMTKKLKTLGLGNEATVESFKNNPNRPKEWMFDTQTGSSKQLTNVTISSAVILSSINVDTYVDWVLKYIPDSFKAIEKGSSSLGGQEARWVTFQVKGTGVPEITELAYFIKDGSSIWSIVYASAPDEFKARRPIFEQSAASFTIKAHLTIVSSLPMSGIFQTQVLAIVNAMQLRVDQAQSTACNGKYALRYQALDDASATLGKWDATIETDNARSAAEDRSTIAYLGTFNSAAAMLSIPILNKAGPMVMISPATTNPALTKAGLGLPGVTEAYYPTGVRNFARVVQADDVQGASAAGFVSSLGAKSVYILDDREGYGKAAADAFEARAKEIGLTVLGHESFDPKARDYKTLMTKIASSNQGEPPDAIYAGTVAANNAAQLLKDKVSIVGDNSKVKFIGPDDLQSQSFIDSAGADIAEGIYASTSSLPIERLPGSTQQFVRDYEAVYGKLTEPYAVYGYETMNVTLKAIEDVCAAGGDPGDRASVNRAVFAIKDFKGILGSWSFDKNGDTSLTDTFFYQVKNGVYVLAGTSK